MPRVSVISCVYNLEELVLETVHSVLNQTYRDFEFIIVDDGSTDRTVERLESVNDPRFKIIRAPHSGLPAVGRNRALAVARPGEFVAIADADDVWMPERLRMEIDFLDRHPNVGVVHSQVEYVVDGRVTTRSELGIPAGVMAAVDVLRRLLHQNFIYNPTSLLRASDLQRINGLYDEDPRLCGPEDFDMWLRLAEAGVPFGYIDEPLVRYRIRSDSVSRNRVRSLTGNIVAIHAALLRSPNVYAANRRLVNLRLAYLYRELAGCKFRAGLTGAWSDLYHSLQCGPFNLRTWSWGCLGLLGSNRADKILSMREQWRISREAGIPVNGNGTIS
jgi:glycosyltransferase involved in cell wall biosynthesis